MRSAITTVLLSGPLLWLEMPAGAQTAPDADPVSLRADWTQFVSAVASGAGDDALAYGGRVDGYARIDGEAAGIAGGLTINLQAEFVYGRNSNRIGAGLLLPVNTALNFPASDGEAFDLSFNIVQRIGAVRLQIGKINLLDASASLPVVGGGGKEGFMHVGLAAPPALLTTPKIFGVIASVPAGRLILTFGVWTPDDWTRRYVPGGLFDDGVNAMAVALLPVRIGGRQGYHTLTVIQTSRRVRPGTDYPDLRPPEGSGPLLPTRPGGTHLRYAIQQYLWQDPTDPQRGWGVFGHVGLSFGAPGILDWSMNAGIAGSSPIAGRARDRFGIGVFRFSLADRLTAGLAPTLATRDETGAELFYTAQIGKRLRVTASGQLVDPVLRDRPVATYFNLRAKLDF